MLARDVTIVNIKPFLRPLSNLLLNIIIKIFTMLKILLTENISVFFFVSQLLNEYVIKHHDMNLFLKNEVELSTK